MLSNQLNRLTRRLGFQVTRIAPSEADYWQTEHEYWESRLRDFYNDAYGLELDPRQTDPSFVPPPSLAGLIQFPNKADRHGYFATGYRTTIQYQRELAEFDMPPTKISRLLEMGVGLGRLMIHYLPFKIELFGCDVTPEVADWTRERFGSSVQIADTGLDPPLPYESSQFDFVYANSVFTHIPIIKVKPWAEELARIIRPGGLLIFSTLDANHYMRFLSHREFNAIEINGGAYEWNIEHGVKMMSYSTHARIRTDWGQHFDVLDIRQLFREQSHVICRKPFHGKTGA